MKALGFQAAIAERRGRRVVGTMSAFTLLATVA